MLSLATRTFRNFPDDDMYKQAVTRRCKGIENKELGCKSLTFCPKVLGKLQTKYDYFNITPVHYMESKIDVR